MKLDFTTWPDGEIRRELSAAANDLRLRTDTCNFVSPVAVSATVQKSDEQIVVSGRVNADGLAVCVRCLEEFGIAVDEPFRAVLRIVPPEELAIDTGDDEFFLISVADPVWDMSEEVRQVILLAVPDNPLCRADCRGLCAGCGRNLNAETCVCAPRKSASTLGNLAELIAQSKRRSGDTGR